MSVCVSLLAPLFTVTERLVISSDGCSGVNDRLSRQHIDKAQSFDRRGGKHGARRSASKKHAHVARGHSSFSPPCLASPWRASVLCYRRIKPPPPSIPPSFETEMMDNIHETLFCRYTFPDDFVAETPQQPCVLRCAVMPRRSGSA